MTGTPIYNNILDLIWLVNIAACKTVIPINLKKFNEDFYEISSVNAALYGWIKPFMESYIPLFFVIYFALAVPLGKGLDYGFEVFQEYRQNKRSLLLASALQDDTSLKSELGIFLKGWKRRVDLC